MVATEVVAAEKSVRRLVGDEYDGPTAERPEPECRFSVPRRQPDNETGALFASTVPTAAGCVTNRQIDALSRFLLVARILYSVWSPRTMSNAQNVRGLN